MDPHHIVGAVTHQMSASRIQASNGSGAPEDSMHESEGGHNLDGDNRYWTDKLATFRHGPCLLPSALSGSGDGFETVVRDVHRAPLGDSPDMLPVAALVLVLGRYNGGEPLLVASPASASDRRPVFFRWSPGEDRQASEFLEEIRAEVEASMRRQPCPLEQVSAALGLDVAEQRRAFLQVVYAPAPVDEQSALAMSAGLLLDVDWRDEGVSLRFRFARARYPVALIRQLAEHVATAMSWLANAGQSRLQDAELMSDAERCRLVHEFNDTAVERRPGQTLHGLVSRRAERTPEAIAVIHRKEQPTYTVLGGRSDFRRHTAPMAVGRPFGTP